MLYYTDSQTKSISESMLSLSINKYKQKQLWVKNILEYSICSS